MIVTSKDCFPLANFPIVQPNWFNCPVLSNGSETINNVHAQCMFVNVPIDWNTTTNLTTCTETIRIFIKRYFIKESKNTGHQLWRIAGGGGIPISTLESEAIRVVSKYNGAISIYATDKRGVGESDGLECPISIFLNFSSCLSYIKEHQYRLKHNTFTNMARNLQYVLKVVSNRQTLKSNQRVILMGSSQGTYLLQRYLHLIENERQIDGVILDSVVPTDFIDLIKYDKYVDYMFLDLLLRCAHDKQGCANKFEDQNPLRAAYTYKINEEIQGNLSCLSSLNTTSIEIGIQMSYLYFPLVMQLIPPLIYRINRCNSQDKIVLQHFLKQTSSSPFPYNRPGYSMLVALNNDLTELWSTRDHNDIQLSCEYVKGMSDNTFMAMQLMSNIYCPIQRTGVLGYNSDQYYRTYPILKTQIPVLVLHGDMDETLPLPIARHFYKKYSSLNSNLTYIEMPRTGHTAIDASPMIDQETSCGWLLVMSFILSSTFQPDRSCLNKISPIDFAGTTTNSQELSTIYFGTHNMWD
ncbi:unnamed protein product [Rotaria sp. Silwood2]|nr:unnamed protein product [Rotaria sp. Silwood2]CAF4445163.1 unnamed protein product [Rotaria sp. Silwood2]